MKLSPEKRKKLSRWIIGIAAARILIFLAVQNIGVVADAAGWVLGLFAPPSVHISAEAFALERK